MAKYMTIHADNKTIVVSKYAGKPVRGIAKCDPNDLYNGVFGERLAKARCDLKVSEKRQLRAAELTSQALTQLEHAQARVEKMMLYLKESTEEVAAAEQLVRDIEAEAGVQH